MEELSPLAEEHGRGAPGATWCCWGLSCPAFFFLLLPHCWTPETHLWAVPSGFQPFFCPLHPFTGRILPRAGGDRASPSQHLLFLVPPLLHPTQLVSPGCAPGPSSCRVLAALVLFPKKPLGAHSGAEPLGGQHFGHVWSPLSISEHSSADNSIFTS